MSSHCSKALCGFLWHLGQKPGPRPRMLLTCPFAPLLPALERGLVRDSQPLPRSSLCLGHSSSALHALGLVPSFESWFQGHLHREAHWPLLPPGRSPFFSLCSAQPHPEYFPLPVHLGSVSSQVVARLTWVFPTSFLPNKTHVWFRCPPSRFSQSHCC